MTDELPLFDYDTAETLLDEVTGEVERTDGAIDRTDGAIDRTDSGMAA